MPGRRKTLVAVGATHRGLARRTAPRGAARDPRELPRGRTDPAGDVRHHARRERPHRGARHRGGEERLACPRAGALARRPQLPGAGRPRDLRGALAVCGAAAARRRGRAPRIGGHDARDRRAVEPASCRSVPWAEAFPRLFEVYTASNQASPGNWFQLPEPAARVPSRPRCRWHRPREDGAAREKAEILLADAIIQGRRDQQETPVLAEGRIPQNERLAHVYREDRRTPGRPAPRTQSPAGTWLAASALSR
jgi:hypothetical protein